MAFTAQLEHQLLNLADSLPLELFSFLGSFVEEVIAPIPSPIVMTVTGTLASVQEKPLIYLLILSLAGAFGKVLGATVLYFFSDKLEDLLLTKLGRYIGVSHKEIESVGKHISGSWRDVLILTFVRMLPMVPSAPVSIACGLLKVNKKIFWASTFLGTIVRDGFYLYIGYTGASALYSVLSGLSTTETIVQGLILMFFIAFLAYLYHKRRKGDVFGDIKKLFSKGK